MAPGLTCPLPYSQVPLSTTTQTHDHLPLRSRKPTPTSNPEPLEPPSPSLSSPPDTRAPTRNDGKAHSAHARPAQASPDATSEAVIQKPTSHDYSPDTSTRPSRSGTQAIDHSDRVQQAGNRDAAHGGHELDQASPQPASTSTSSAASASARAASSSATLSPPSSPQLSTRTLASLSASTSSAPSTSPKSASGAIGPQRTPSIRAQNAFSRLRIGSFGGAPRPNLPSSPSSPSSPRALTHGRNDAPVPRSQTSAESTTSSSGTGGKEGDQATEQARQREKEQLRTLSPDSYANPPPTAALRTSISPTPSSPSPNRFRTLEASIESLASTSSNFSTISSNSDSSCAVSPTKTYLNTSTAGPGVDGKDDKDPSATDKPKRRTSLAASFLSNFSPRSSLVLQSRSRGASKASQRSGGGGDWPAFAGALPPRGDEAGFVIRVKGFGRGRGRGRGQGEEEDEEEEEEEEEWVLGEELGRGGMGLVREVRLLAKQKQRRGSETKGKGKGKERDESVENVGMDVEGREREESGESRPGGEEEEEEIKLAVKIIPRRLHHASDGVGNTITLRQPPIPRGRYRDPSAPPLTSPSTSRSPSAHPTPLPTPTPRQTGFTSSSSYLSASSPVRKPSRSPSPAPSLSSGAPRSRERDRLIAQLEQRARSTSSPVRLRPSLAGGRSSTMPSVTPVPTPPGTPPPVEGAEERGEEGEGGYLGLTGMEAQAQGEPQEEDMLDLLLQRELTLWGQLSTLAATSSSSSSPPLTSSRPSHDHIIPLLATHRTLDFDYIFMPLATGGTLLSYLNKPRPPPTSSTSTSRSRSCLPHRSRSRSRVRLTAAGKPLSSSSSSSHHHSHLSSTSPTKPLSSSFTSSTSARSRPRAPISSLGALAHTHAPPPPTGLELPEAAEVFSQIVEGLKWLHEEVGVAHRDVKLENLVAVLVSSDDEEEEEEEEEEVVVVGGVEDERERIREGRGRSRTRRGGGGGMLETTSESVTRDRTHVESNEVGRRRKKRRVWKLADFGLAEVVPPPGPSRGSSPLASRSSSSHSLAPQPPPPSQFHSPHLPSGKKSVIQGVLPLSALARAGSLKVAGGHEHHPPQSPSLPQQQQPQPHSQSAFLPTPHAQPHSHNFAATGPIILQGHFRAAPPASLAQHPLSPDAPSPLSALLHPVGSLPYSSPEALKSPVPIIDFKGDVWALGCVLYALVEGKMPIWEEWEWRLRVRLVKGEWEVPTALAPPVDSPSAVDTHGDKPVQERVAKAKEKEKALALEVLKGCLEVDVSKRWTIGQIFASEWMDLVRTRRSDEKERREREKRERNEQRRRRREIGARVEEEEQDACEGEKQVGTGIERERGRSRGRQLGRCPPAPSARTGNGAPTLSGSGGGGGKSGSRSRSRTSPPSTSSTRHLPHYHAGKSRSRSRSSVFSASSALTGSSILSVRSLSTTSHSHSHSRSSRASTSNSQQSHSRRRPSPMDVDEVEEEEPPLTPEEKREERRMRWEVEEREAEERRERRSRSRVRGEEEGQYR